MHDTLRHDFFERPCLPRIRQEPLALCPRPVRIHAAFVLQPEDPSIHRRPAFWFDSDDVESGAAVCRSVEGCRAKNPPLAKPETYNACRTPTTAARLANLAHSVGGRVRGEGRDRARALG